MALDRIGLEMIAPLVRGADILSLGYPDITVDAVDVELVLGVKPSLFTAHGSDHGVKFPLPDTAHTLALAGAAGFHACDVKEIRGGEVVLDLNERQHWKQTFDLVINPGTIEHCFDVAMAWRNAWSAVAVGGSILHVFPMSMMNHGFWCISPTAFYDHAAENGGHVVEARARDRDWKNVPIQANSRFRVPPETVGYILVEKMKEVPWRIPTQWRFR